MNSFTTTTYTTQIDTVAGHRFRPVRSLLSAQGPHRKHGVFGLSKREHPVAGHHLSPVKALLIT